MNNPLSRDPRLALYPHPVNCTGWRLWRMYHDVRAAGEPGVAEEQTRREYIGGFDRRNLLSGAEWSDAEARIAAPSVMSELWGRRVLVLGVRTLRALRLSRYPWLQETTEPGPSGPGPLVYSLAPHPSGLCHEYNDPAMRQAVGQRLLDMLASSTKEKDDGTS